jgi:hypothetical protein
MIEEKQQAVIDRYRLLYGDRLDKVVGEIQTQIFSGDSADMVFCFRRHIAEIGFLLDALITKIQVVETPEAPTPPAAMN